MSAVADAPVAEEAVRRLLLRIGLAIFFTMNVVVFTMELWSQDVYADASYQSTFAVHLRGLFQWASLLFALPVLLLLGGPIAAGVRQSLQRRTATTDLLILLGVSASYIYSAVSVLRGEGQVYFEIGCVVLVFVSLGRWLESCGKHRTGAALDALARLLPEQVRRAVTRHEPPSPRLKTTLVPRDEIEVGDLVRILPGERLPVDGRIAAGRATLDEQIATGESRPVVKGVGDQLYSGTVNLDGDLWINVTASAGHDLVSRLLHMVREARRMKGRHERLVDRVAGWFTPLVCAVAFAAGAWHAAHFGLDRGILVGLAVVLIACPCALGLATPMAVWTAMGRAADRQVLFRSSAVLERLAAVQAVCFDKTGTLTSGAPRVRELIVAHSDERDLALAFGQSLASGSLHGLSRAIGRFANEATIGDAVDMAVSSKIASLISLAGRGVEARDDGGRVVARLGSSRWMIETRTAIPATLTDLLARSGIHDAPLAFVAWDGVVRGVFVFAEELRPEARDAVAACRDLGLRTMVLTGDGRTRAAAVAKQLGLESMSDQLPEDKVASLQRLHMRVAMVGDGLNDAPALAAADVGIALGCGAELSRDAAGVCLLSDQIDRLPWAIALARRTMVTVRQNLFWAFAYNVAGIFLAAAGQLNPIWAAAAMGASSLIVVGNSLRLARFDIPASTADTHASLPQRDLTENDPSAPAINSALLDWRHATFPGASPERAASIAGASR